MGNQTELFLSGLSNLPNLQLPLFLFFLLVFLLTVTWNILIITLIVKDSHLHTPMYFFLGNLASLDLCCSSVTIPRLLFDLHKKLNCISTRDCITQIFFLLFFASCEMFLLVIMSYDRYNAICHPLRYVQIMSWRTCVQLTLWVWCLGFTHSLVHTLYASKLTFCESNTIRSFFCDLPQLLQISCSDIFINLLFILLLGGFLAAGTLLMTFLPYVYIIKTVLKIQFKGNRKKVFSTCTSHLAVVFLFYGSGSFNYLRPRGSYYFAGSKVLSIFYTVITPLINPLIYSLRNQDFRRAFGDILMRTVSKVI